MPDGAYNPHRRVAVIFDFDDTLVPDSSGLLLNDRGVDPVSFWRDEALPLVRRGYDPTLAWLKCILDNVGEDKRLGLLNRANLHEFGKRIQSKLYPGVEDLSGELKSIARGVGWTVDLFVISGGLEDVIRGVLGPEAGFTDFYGSLLDEGGTPLRLTSVMRAITFTEKTRYLFEINKGISAKETLEQPYAVNKEVPDERRPIPLQRMIYVGDGLTDIPCFSLLTRAGGFPFGVFNPRNRDSVKRAFEDIAMPRRTLGLHSPRYGPDDDLGSLIREAVLDICGRAT